MEDNLNFYGKSRMTTSKKNGRRPQNKKKMEDNLKKNIKIEAHLKKYNGRRTNQPKSS